MAQSTALYRAILLAVERRRLQLGWPMWLVDERSGVQSGYYAKLLYSETPSGRRANWQTLQWIVDALWPDGIGARLTGPAIDDDETFRLRIEAAARRYRKRDQEQRKVRPHLREFASAARP